MDNFSALLGKKLAGSGGGSGTSNYNELENKPQINGQTLNGNKTAANLGLQSVINQNNKLDADLIDDSESEKKLVSQNDISNWNGKFDSDDAYTKTQTDAAITEAISALDVAATGGAGQYISSISETNGKIVPTPTTFDTALSSSSTNGNAPTSKTVFDDQQRQDALEAEDRAALVGQVDGGAKNLFQYNPVSVPEISYVINDDGSITVTANSTTTIRILVLGLVTNLKDGEKYTLSGISGGNYDKSYGFAIATSNATGKVFLGNGYTDFVKTSEMYQLELVVRAGQSWTKTFYPMICIASDWAISPKFVPYAPTNRELYEMIQALQSGGASTQSMQPTLMSAAKPMISTEETSEKEAEQDEVSEIEEKESVKDETETA